MVKSSSNTPLIKTLLFLLLLVGIRFMEGWGLVSWQCGAFEKTGESSSIYVRGEVCASPHKTLGF